MLKGMGQVFNNLDRWYQQKMAGVQGVGTVLANEFAAEAKAEHPWKNQTHHAEQGLYGKFRWDGSSAIIELGHRVDYGPALELANDGKYGILEKKLNSRRLVVYNRVKQIMESKI